VRFVDRAQAGRLLARQLEPWRDTDVVVVGLPRGGVVVAAEVARALRAPLDVIVVRKLGVPYQPELAMGAVGEGGVLVLHADTVALAGVTQRQLAEVEAVERAHVEARLSRLRGVGAGVPLAGRSVVIVDDGIATGSTARAACQVARAQGARHVVLAAPVAPPEQVRALEHDADEVVVLSTPRRLSSIGQWYDDFGQTSDEQVAELLREAAARDVGHPAGPGVAVDEELELPLEGAVLAGHLVVPAGATGLVVFAHGSGSSRHSPRNQAVAAALVEGGLGTLLIDLLTPQEERRRANVFDVDLLGARLVQVIEHVHQRPGTSTLSLGVFGASTGAAAALWAAAERPDLVAVVVSRGGRPDLAAPRLPHVSAPTLLIVGGRDQAVLDLNRRAQALLRCPSDLVIVPGATHLFEEPGALDQVAALARRWFVDELAHAAVAD
jgi:putative phosphoribosyl transferase